MGLRNIYYTFTSDKFGELENCQPPRGLTWCEVISNVKRAVATVGDEISVFNAYADTQLMFSKISASEPQLGGVTLVDCPHACQKEVADRVLIGECDSTIVCSREF